MAVSIKVRYHRTEIEPALQSYDLRVEVVSATDMPEKIFVRKVGVPPYPGGDSSDTFVCLADPVDLEEIPEDSPDLANEMPYFRVSDITLRFRSMEILEENQALISGDIQNLVDSLKAAANMALTEEVDYA